MKHKNSEDPKVYPTEKDMILAYRKVKAELWWMKTVPALGLLADYENNLQENLKALRERILSGSIEWVRNSDFLGKVVHLPKKLHEKSKPGKTPIHYVELSDKKEVKQRKMMRWQRLECRPMAIPSIDFQIIGVLWTMGAGADWDAGRAASCRANVLRRLYVPADDAEFPDVEATLRGPINKNYPGVFKPYFHSYKRWRNDGLKRAKGAVANGQRVFALTLDLRRYFHQIDASCLQVMRPPTEGDNVTRCFYASLQAWQETRGEEPYEDKSRKFPKMGVPVGLIASALVANLVLQPLDEAIERRLSPIYYGRYVDDLFLVLDLNGEFKDGESVMKGIESLMLQEGMEGLSFKWDDSEDGYGGLLFKYEGKWKKSLFECKAEKQRLFLLEGKPGADLLGAIDSDLLEHSSEWRMVPDLDEDDDQWLKEILIASQDAAEGASSLRRADGLSIKRLGVAVALRKLEAIERFQLKASAWGKYRNDFYDIALSHIFSPEGLCDFWPKLPALFGLVFSNDDWKAANRFLTQLNQARESYQNLPERPHSDCLTRWLSLMIADELKRSCKEPPKTKEARRFIKRFKQLFRTELPNDEQLADAIEDFKNRDLDRVGHRMRVRRSMEPSNFIDAARTVTTFLEDPILLSQLAKTYFWLLFPTRPLGEMEICLLDENAIVSNKRMRELMFSVRGQDFQEILDKPKDTGLTKWAEGKEKWPPPPHLHLIPEFSERSVKVAISNYQTETASWTDRVRGKPDFSVKRLQSLLGLIDDFLRTTKQQSWQEQPLYFCLPELSVPHEWLHEISGYFSKARISLIAGAEYNKGSSENLLFNQAYLFLRNRNLGYPTTWVIRQKKTAPAPREALDLWRECELKLEGQSVEKLPVYTHGDFRFGLVICSELTDAKIHHHFRGFVDAIICLEWNPDIDTFSALVESTAQTIHCFIVQVNNRKYGDSRIRAPAKERFNRDLSRLHGGIHDSFVVGELPVKELRSFQKNVHPDSGEKAKYKPLPSGYDPRNFWRLYPEVTKMEQ